MSQKMLTVKEVAERISVTEWVVRQWVRQGKVPGAVKFGRTIRIPEAFVTDGTAQENVAASEGDSGSVPALELDYDPRDTWPPVEPVEVGEAPEPIDPPSDEED